MKTIQKQMKSISLLFISLILFQSCRVYHKESVNITKAFKSKMRVKIKTRKNKTLKFAKIIKENNKYFGVKSNKNSGKFTQTLLIEDEIQAIRLHNKSLSIILGILFPTIIFAGLVLLTIYGGNGSSIGTPNFVK